MITAKQVKDHLLRPKGQGRFSLLPGWRKWNHQINGPMEPGAELMFLSGPHGSKTFEIVEVKEDEGLIVREK